MIVPEQWPYRVARIEKCGAGRALPGDRPAPGLAADASVKRALPWP